MNMHHMESNQDQVKIKFDQCRWNTQFGIQLRNKILSYTGLKGMKLARKNKLKEYLEPPIIHWKNELISTSLSRKQIEGTRLKRVKINGK